MTTNGILPMYPKRNLNTSQLRGDDLDQAVALVDLSLVLDYDPDAHPCQTIDGERKRWHPSTDWSQGGPIMEREQIAVEYQSGWHAKMEYGASPDGVQHARAFGTTILLAAMRCYVASKFGETVELP
jgi:hypothetical protein